MEQTNDIDALMEKIQAQETAYEFDRIDEDLALQMGIYVIRRAREMGKPIAARITLNRRTLFAYSMPARSLKAITGSAARRTSYMRPMAVLTIGSAGARRAIILSSGVA